MERRGWIKVHAAVDTESKERLSLGVTDEKTGNSEVFEDLIENLDLEDCLADGAYDQKNIRDSGGKRSESTARRQTLEGPPDSLSPRGEATREFRELVYEKWKEKHDYGKRWSVEEFFSAVKRCFDETVRAASPEGMIREMKRKFVLYNLIATI